MKVWKYEVPLGIEPIVLEIPQGGKPLSAQAQGKTMCMWTTVDPELPREHRLFAWVATGEDFPGEHIISHIDTVQIDRYVFHLFEIENF